MEVPGGREVTGESVRDGGNEADSLSDEDDADAASVGATTEASLGACVGPGAGAEAGKEGA